MSQAAKAAHVECAVDTRRAPDRGSSERNLLYIKCTKEGGARCKLLDHRRELNKVLLSAGLEVREDRLGQSRGDVHIAVIQSSTCAYVLYGSGEDSRKAKALDLVEHLLVQHHCITAMEFNRNFMHRPSLLQVAKFNLSLKSVTVCGRFVTPGEAAFMFKVIKSLSPLKKLAFKVCKFENNTGDMMRFFGSSYLLGMNFLTTLDVAEVIIPVSEAYRLIQALVQNKSITDLAVGASVCNYRDEASIALFPRYLGQENCMLRKLKLKSAIFVNGFLFLEELINAFCKMKFLEELIADIVVMNASFVHTVALFAEVVTRSATLRRLRLPWTSYPCHVSFCIPNDMLPDPEAAQCMKPWLEALRKPHSLLKKLCIDLRGFGEAECHDFFNAIADSASVMSVVVHFLPNIDGLDRVCATIENRGLKDRVVIKGHYTHMTAKQLQECPLISSASIRECHVLRRQYLGVQPVISALGVVSSCAHITSLRVDCSDFDRNDFSALAAYISGPSALTDVDIDLSHIHDNLTAQGKRYVQSELVSALASNLKLVRVSVTGAQLSHYDYSVLADGANKSISITDFTLTPGCTSAAIHDAMHREVRSCPLHMTESFTGASDAKNNALADILEATTKNASAVLDAAHFVLGEQDGVDSARAIELLHDHPRVLQRVMERADVTKAEAKKMINRAWLRVHRCSLDEFMRMSGVIKERMECIGHPGTRLQLADLSHYCLLHIRSFLKIADVLQD
ncbi:hypothetical protein HPB49_018107 [Dermacentor silvarum]|uniref:Uncharacterized protein n=1 Tax=Dermacentor silvarum TaxID=543639 RepID=A0ACB8CSK8_DERSI|nr:uncharacterized protein LOC125945426 [Dermacentor silvarum]KAH7949994.1 hypothetical protein HPB49_018107 [Dermacentor silvarum]